MEKITTVLLLSNSNLSLTLVFNYLKTMLLAATVIGPYLAEFKKKSLKHKNITIACFLMKCQLI